MGRINIVPNQTIVFIGDSITDCSRQNPAYTPFGKGYVNFVANLLIAKYPDYNLKIYNRGIGGNTTRDLKARWREDCLGLKPDILSVLIGVNDLWERYLGPDEMPFAVSPDEYETNLCQLLDQVQKLYSHCQFVLMEPFMFCTDRKNSMFNELFAYVKVIDMLSERYNSVLVSLQKLLDDKMKQTPSDRWSSDMVHPNVWAHAWIAQQWLETTKL